MSGVPVVIIMFLFTTCSRAQMQSGANELTRHAPSNENSQGEGGLMRARTAIGPKGI